MVFGLLLRVLLALLFAFSTALAGGEDVVREFFKPLKGIKVEEVRKVSSPKVPGFETYEVLLSSTTSDIRAKRYIWVSKDLRFITTNMASIERQGKKLAFRTLKPSSKVPPAVRDVSWLKDVEKRLNKAGIPHVIGKGKRKLYVIWDVLCPFCFRHFAHMTKKEAEKLGVEIHAIPYAVHGESSIEGLAYFAQLAREKGIDQAFKHFASLGKDFGEFRKNLKKELKKAKFDSNFKRRAKIALRAVKRMLGKNRIVATPTYIYLQSPSKKGCIFVGYESLEEVVNCGKRRHNR
jgi:thiol:disulfide interchange protein DsbC